MKIEITALLPHDGEKPIASTRTVQFDVCANNRLPDCAFCRKNALRPIFEVRQMGFTVDLVSCLTICDDCGHGVIVQFEEKRG